MACFCSRCSVPTAHRPEAKRSACFGEWSQRYRTGDDGAPNLSSGPAADTGRTVRPPSGGLELAGQERPEPPMSPGSPSTVTAS